MSIIEHSDQIGTSLRNYQDIQELRYCTIALVRPIIRDRQEHWFREFLNAYVSISDCGQFLIIKEYYFDKYGHEEFVLDKLLVYPIAEIQNITIKSSTFVEKYLDSVYRIEEE